MGTTHSTERAAPNRAAGQSAQPGQAARPHRLDRPAPGGGPGQVIAIWAPDWPAAAAAADVDLDPATPIAVLAGNRVIACSGAARQAGVRRGQRRREAQSTCPELVIAGADLGRDARHFEAVVAAIAEVIPGAEVFRPGLLVVPARGAVRFFASLETAAERLIDAAATVGVEVQVGAADGLFSAVVAARRSLLVPGGTAAGFLAPLSIRELLLEPSLIDAGRDDLVDLLWRLGIRTLGDFAALDVSEVATRFGTEAVRAHRQASAAADRPPSARPLPPDLQIEYRPDPPIDRVDAAAFVARILAGDLHARLAAASLACMRLSVTAVTETGEENCRIWRCATALTPEGTADRVRWQLEGWLTAGKIARAEAGRAGSVNRGKSRAGTAGARQAGARQRAPESAIALLRLEPVEAVGATELQRSLFGDTGEAADRARRALLRVQGLLGQEAVQVAVRSGGRGPAEQISWVPLGDEARPALAPDGPWPGRLPDPAPSVLPDAPIVLRDAADDLVEVTERGHFSSEPVQLSWGSRTWAVRWWAGPWPVEERWWATGTSALHPAVAARAQVLLEDSRALLLHFGAGAWRAEGIYE